MNTRLPALCFALFLTAARGEIVTLTHPGESLPANSTVVWSPVFQAAWDKLNTRLGGPPVRVEPPNALMARLDAFRWKPGKVLPGGAWQAWCGPATRDFLNQVNREAAAITREPEGPFKLLQESSGSLAFFSLLDRTVEFQRAFSRSNKIPMKFQTSDGGHPVRFFGVRDEAGDGFGDSVRILAWRPVDRSHAIQIRCKQADDTVILYLPGQNQDFATACHWLRTWRSQSKPDAGRSGAWDDCVFHSGDEIQIPYVTLESNADHTLLFGGVRYHGEKGKPAMPWSITRVEQLTRFELHEKGARVRVEVSGEAAALGPGPPPTVPRRFLYDHPFFVFLWRDQAEWPYFGAWIGDASALRAFP